MQQSPTDNNEKDEIVEKRKKPPHPKLSELIGTSMSLSGDEDSLIAEATQNLVQFAMTKGHTKHTVTHMSKTQLADFLRDFYGKVKIKSTDFLTLKDLRAGLRRFFLDEVSIDIVSDRTFELANAAFDLAQRANRKCHRMRIETEDLKKIYLSEAMDTNRPDTLQNKVFFDISLYICNKGKEYFRNMKKNDFDVSTDISGRRYVWLKESSSLREEELPIKLQLKRSVNEESQACQVGERMYERPGDPRCPLSSFLKYVTHLHPMTDAFWQRPKRNVSPSDYVWYDHAQLGSSTLTKIMQRISLQAGLSDNYTNYSIRSTCIPLVEAVCEEALQAEGGRTVNSIGSIIKPSGAIMSHSASEEMSSDEGTSHSPEGQTNQVNQDTRGSVMVKEEPPELSTSVGPGSMNGDDTDFLGLMQAKTQVLDLIRGLMVKDIQKFVDWLKTVHVQYSNGELIVLCSAVDKSTVESPPEDITVDRNGLVSHRDKNGLNSHTNSHDHLFRKASSLDLFEKRMKLKRNFSFKDTYEDKNDHMADLIGTTIKHIEFNSFGGMHCSSEEFESLKISIPTHDTVLVTGVPDNFQIMLHKKRGPTNQIESLPERMFFSENELDVAEMVATLNDNNHRCSQPVITSSSSITSSCHNSYHSTSESPHRHHLVVQQHRASPVMVTIPAAHTSTLSAHSAREHFKDHRNRSLGCLDQPRGLPEGIALKRVSSTGTPVLRRQANVVDTNMFPENLTVKRPHEDLQATNLSMKPLKKVESLEAKRARAERLDDSLRVHQKILENSPLIKRPGEKNCSGFRHSYTLNSSVKAEPLDTPYG